ncbi:hypothetical protein [Bradyrhizobium sp. AUGA SZCCT0042]|uniref:hypothetical protein n=1 Tax=Bradyrhizobium sp. AUGA SZCCT0042 TaxID=2807651 RepID=UPI001BAE1534|nr:hypothetical protein [Bradyrhizobium sp. AUGA SZCCT0042]MBR1300601.1 hypothetical protein [Bradyrhizobium sp. AUGA SZCCT0042]
MSKQKSNQPAGLQQTGFRVHPNGEIEVLSARETWNIILRALNAAAARALGGRRTEH